MAQKSREEGKIGLESREKEDLPPCPPPPLNVVVVTHEKWSLTRGFKYSNLTWKILVFWKTWFTEGSSIKIKHRKL